MDDVRIGLLREAYARDLIDLETFERFVEPVLEGRLIALPYEVSQLGRRFTDAPGGVDFYTPPNTATMASIVKAAWAAWPTDTIISP